MPIQAMQAPAAASVEETSGKVKIDPGIDLRQRGEALQAAGRFEDAVLCWQSLLATHPGDVEAGNGLANALVSLGRPNEALPLYREVLDSRPTFAPALINLGVTLLRLQRHDEAVTMFERALGLTPESAVACYNLGIALHKGGRDEDAVRWLEKAVEHRPDHAASHKELGDACRALKRNEAAIAAYRRALALKPDMIGVAQSLAQLLQQNRRFDQAAAIYRRLLQDDPGKGEWWNHLGTALLGAEDYPASLASFRRAVALQPGLAAGHCNMALALYSLGRLPEAVDACNRALAIEPGSAATNLNMACVLLAQGRFGEGWAAYEHRFAASGNGWFRTETKALPWIGEALRGRSIVVLGEQGNGDHLHFARYVPMLCTFGATVAFTLPARLHRLFSTLPGEVALLGDVPTEARFDFQCPLMSLPHRFGLLGHDIPADVPYLKAEPERVSRWRERIGDHGFRVGVAWRGNHYPSGDFKRSFSLAELGPIGAVSGVRLISLQIGEGTGQLAQLPGTLRVESLGDDFDAGEHAFVDAAAVMECLDLVVTLDSAIAHLAGALARPVWIALTYTPEWRWLCDRTDNPWYPTARLFRQSAPGDWDGVFTRMAAALRQIV